MFARGFTHLIEQIRKRWLLIYVITAVFLKCLILTGFAVNRTYSAPDLWGAVSESFAWIPSLSIYLSWAIILAAPCFLMQSKGYRRYLVLLDSVLSVLFLIDVWYFRAFFKFSSVVYLHELVNLPRLSSAVLSFVRIWDFLFVADAVILVFLELFHHEQRQLHRNIPVFLALFLLPFGYLLYFDSTRTIAEDSLFSTRWAPVETISVLSPVGYHINDILSYWTEKKALILTDKERAKIRTWFEKIKEPLPPNGYDGLFRGRNLILLQCESLENFVIGKTIAGQEITPVLNRMKQHSLYFRNIMEQVGDGTSIDAEFMVNTSIYPLRTGSVSLRYPGHHYNSLPMLFQQQGYTTWDIHPDHGSYWNWAEFMQSVGMEQCIDSSHFNIDEVIDLGLSDGSFLRQSVPILSALKQPFYAYMITLSNHVPYDLPKRFRELKLDPKLDQSEVGGYLQSVHYTDKQIGIFLSNLEASGLLSSTVVAVFGDHCGIHKFSEDALNKLSENQRRWMENGYRIPFLVFSKGVRGRTIDKIGGQIDIFPTIASLMGVSRIRYEQTTMGRNLLNSRKSFAVLYDGTFVGTAGSEDEKKRAVRGLKIADEIVRSDYFSQYQK